MANPKKLVIIYITAADRTEARKIARSLVKSRLAACVNILGRIESLYHWEGKFENAKEVALIAKTRKELVSQVIKKVKSLHSYSCPCVVAIPIIGGSKDFLSWILEETK